MAELLNAHICEKVERDEKTGKESIIGIFTALHAPSLPVIHEPPPTIYTMWEGLEGEEELSFNIFIRDPNGKVIGKTKEKTVRFTKRYKSVSWKVRAKFSIEGEHSVIIRTIEGDVRSLPLTITVDAGIIH